MVQINSSYTLRSHDAPPHCPPRDACFNALSQQAQHCGCHRYRNFFHHNQQQIRERCSGRDPHAYRTDRQGCRWENGRIAQTQINQQDSTSATVTVGNNKLTFNKNDRSVRIQNADGTEQTVDWKLFEDPHVSKDGREIGTIKRNLSITLKDGSEVDVLMGNASGGAPRPGEADFVNSVAARSPDGTGVLVTGISGPEPLGVTPLDSSLSSDFMADRAMNKFGHYEASRVFIDRNGNMIDQSNGQIVHDQAGLDRLDQQQGRDRCARSLYNQGYVPKYLADQFDRPFDRYDSGMRRLCEDQMSLMLELYQQMQSRLSDIGNLRLPLVRHFMPHAFRNAPYGIAY